MTKLEEASLAYLFSVYELNRRTLGKNHPETTAALLRVSGYQALINYSPTEEILEAHND